MSINRSTKEFAARIAKLHPGQQTLGKKGIIAKRTEDGKDVEFRTPANERLTYITKAGKNIEEIYRFAISQLSRAQ